MFSPVSQLVLVRNKGFCEWRSDTIYTGCLPNDISVWNAIPFYVIVFIIYAVCLILYAVVPSLCAVGLTFSAVGLLFYAVVTSLFAFSL